MRPRRPSIFQVGRLVETGDEVRITGWGLGLCMAGCRCHGHPVHGHLTITEDPVRGHLGLLSHRPCDCCEPWRAHELADILRDLAVIEQIPTTAPTEREEQA